MDPRGRQGNTPEIGVDELDDLLRSGSVQVLDVREDWEFRRRRVPGATSVPLGRLTAQVGTLPREKPYAVICESGSRSVAATDSPVEPGVRGGRFRARWHKRMGSRRSAN